VIYRLSYHGSYNLGLSNTLISLQLRTSALKGGTATFFLTTELAWLHKWCLSTWGRHMRMIWLFSPKITKQ